MPCISQWSERRKVSEIVISLKVNTVYSEGLVTGSLGTCVHKVANMNIIIFYTGAVPGGTGTFGVA